MEMCVNLNFLANFLKNLLKKPDKIKARNKLNTEKTQV